MRIEWLPLLAVTVIGGTAHPAGARTASDVAGTYELILCKGACSFAERRNVFATAFIVLFDGVMPLKDVDRIDPTYLYDPRQINACYVVKRKTDAPSYADAGGIGVSTWQRDGHAIHLLLFHSPDAGYSVEVKRQGTLLAGSGTSSGVGMGAPPPGYDPDTIVGRRLGPPDVSVCRADTHLP
jgi:hypothetical protein